MSDECMHLLDPQTCTICNGREKRERVTQSWSNPFTAKYDGYCTRCRGSIDAGDQICISDGAVAHEDCAT